MNIKEYRNYRGLVIMNPADKDRDPENAFLWSLEQLLLLDLLDMKEEADELRESMNVYLKQCYNHLSGCYDNIVALRDPDNKDSYTSPDQLESYLSFAIYTGQTTVIHRINNQLDLNAGTYNNLTGEFSLKRIMHPRTLIWSNICSRSESWLDKIVFEAIINHTFETKYKIRPTHTKRIKHFFKTGDWVKRVKIKKTDQELIHWCRFHCYPSYFEGTDIVKHAHAMVAERFDNGFVGGFKDYCGEEHPTSLLAEEYYARTQ